MRTKSLAMQLEGLRIHCARLETELAGYKAMEQERKARGDNTEGSLELLSLAGYAVDMTTSTAGWEITARRGLHTFKGAGATKREALQALATKREAMWALAIDLQGIPPW